MPNDKNKGSNYPYGEYHHLKSAVPSPLLGLEDEVLQMLKKRYDLVVEVERHFFA